MHFTEDMFEQAVIELFENMGYTHIYAPDMERDYTSPLLDAELVDSLVKLNKGLPLDAINEAVAKLRDFDTGNLLQKNMAFMDYLQNGVPVKYFNKGEERSTIVYLIDYKNIDRNTFYVVNQFTYIENGNNRRPDIILFINGLPLVLMELKSPSKDEVGAENAYNQIRNYMQDIPSIFNYNAICVISDLTTNKAGTITSGLDRFMEWKTKDGNYENTAYAQFDTFYEGMFQKARLLDIIKNFICFSVEQAKSFKILAGYHQYFAVRRAVDKAKVATTTDGKGGVFWHTQGSGKSLSMVFYAHLLQEALNSPTIVVMTDRIDLDDQLYAQFSKCAGFLRQTPVQAESKVHLKELLANRTAILLCVTVSAVAGTIGPSGAAVSMIFAVSAKTGTIAALSAGGFGAFTAGLVTGFETGDFEEAMKAAALAGSEGFKWGAIGGSISGGATEAIALKGATLNGLTMNQAALIQRQSGYPLDVIKQFQSMEQFEICQQAGLTPHMVNGQTALIRNIDLNYVDEFGRTNLERMKAGLSAIDPATEKSYQLHHIGQRTDSTLAILTEAEHMQGGNNTIWHDTSITSTVHGPGNNWDAQRKAFWETMAKVLGGV